MSDAKDQDLDPGDEVTACYPEQKFSPVQYHTFSVGGYFVKTHVRQGETGAQALARAYGVAEKFARAEFTKARDEYLDRVTGIDDEVERRSKQAKAQRRG
jgi:hypothetical protein